MAKHKVRIKVPRLELENVNTIFVVERGGRAYGRLMVGKGGVNWMQRDDKKKVFHWGWSEVDEMFSHPEKKKKTGPKRPKRNRSEPKNFAEPPLKEPVVR